MQEYSGELICGVCGTNMEFTYTPKYDIRAHCPKGSPDYISHSLHPHGVKFGDFPYPPICQTCFSSLILVYNPDNHWFMTVCSNLNCSNYQSVIKNGLITVIYSGGFHACERYFYRYPDKILIEWMSVKDWLPESFFITRFISQRMTGKFYPVLQG